MAYNPSSIIYTLTDPRDDTVRYVGRTTSTGNPELAVQSRLKEHLRCTDTNTRKIAWIRELRTAGMQPIVKVIEVVHWRQGDEKELYWIQFYLSTNAPLTNLRSIGEGNRFLARPPENETDEEQWMPISHAARKLKLPAYQIAKLADVGGIRSEKDRIKLRIRLVELNEVKRAFTHSKYHRELIKDKAEL